MECKCLRDLTLSSSSSLIFGQSPPPETTTTCPWMYSDTNFFEVFWAHQTWSFRSTCRSPCLEHLLLCHLSPSLCVPSTLWLMLQNQLKYSLLCKAASDIGSWCSVPLLNFISTSIRALSNHVMYVLNLFPSKTKNSLRTRTVPVHLPISSSPPK